MVLHCRIFSLVAILFIGSYASARDHLVIVGSGSVHPFMTVATDLFSKNSGNRAPVVESNGTGSGFQLFCAGVGEKTPDISDASRAINPSETALCAKNGVTSITELPIGYDAIVIAQSSKSPPFPLTRKDLYYASAKMIVNAEGKAVPNPNKTWHDVNPALPNTPIRIIGPSPSTGTRDTLTELVFIDFCSHDPHIQHYLKSHNTTPKAFCTILREDNLWIDGGDNYQLSVRKLEQSPQTIAIFPYSFYINNRNRLLVFSMDGATPNTETILSGNYPLSRLLYVYVKDAHVRSIRGMADFLAFLTDEKMLGHRGILVGRGLIPLPIASYTAMRAKVLLLVHP